MFVTSYLLVWLLIERTWRVYLPDAMNKPLESIWAYLQELLPEADLLIFKGREELFLKAILFLVETVHQAAQEEFSSIPRMWRKG